MPTWLADIWKIVATPGVATGLVTAAAGISSATGHPALGTFISDPATAQSLTMAVTSIGALVAGVLQGVKKAPAAPK